MIYDFSTLAFFDEAQALIAIDACLPHLRQRIVALEAVQYCEITNCVPNLDTLRAELAQITAARDRLLAKAVVMQGL